MTVAGERMQDSGNGRQSISDDHISCFMLLPEAFVVKGTLKW